MFAVSMNVTPRSTVRCSVASDSVSSTSPYTGVRAIAPKPIALTDNSSPSLTAGTELAAVMILPFRFGGRSRSWSRRREGIRPAAAVWRQSEPDAPTGFQAAAGAFLFRLRAAPRIRAFRWWACRWRAAAPGVRSAAPTGRRSGGGRLGRARPARGGPPPPSPPARPLSHPRGLRLLRGPPPRFLLQLLARLP